MKQISDRAKKLIENLLGWSTAPHEGAQASRQAHSPRHHRI